RGVAGGVVADADVPRIVVTVHEEEFIGIVGAADLGDWQLAWCPPFAQPRPDGGAWSALRRQRDEALAVGLVDAHDRRARLRRQRRWCRRSPDRRADALVNGFTRMDEDLRDRAAPLERLHGTGHRVALGDDD